MSSGFCAGRRETHGRLVQVDANDLGLDDGGEGREKQTGLRAVMLDTGRQEETT